MSKTILVVDDSPSVRRMVARTLSGAGYSVVEAEDGQAALELTRGTRFNGVITDQNMPRLDGIGFIQAYRTQPEANGVPVIFLSTETESTLKDKARAAGAIGWMTKPFNEAKLLEVMRKVVGQ